MSRRDNLDRRCTACRMLDPGCICALVKPVATRTRIVLAIHADEARKPTGTGLLAARCLDNSAVVVVTDQPPAPFTVPVGMTGVVLAAVDGARPLGDIVRELSSSTPVCLVVPDGTWRQARKIRTRIPGLSSLPCAVLSPGPPTAYRLRSERHEGGLATLEAIARALAILEPADDVERVTSALLTPFRAMVERTLASRGARL